MRFFENVDLFWNSVARWLTMSFLRVHLFSFSLLRLTVVVCVAFLPILHNIYQVLMIGCLFWRQIFRFLVCFFLFWWVFFHVTSSFCSGLRQFCWFALLRLVWRFLLFFRFLITSLHSVVKRSLYLLDELWMVCDPTLNNSFVKDLDLQVFDWLDFREFQSVCYVQLS